MRGNLSEWVDAECWGNIWGDAGGLMVVVGDAYEERLSPWCDFGVVSTL